MVTTVQGEAVLRQLSSLGHATNLELHAALAESMPTLSLPSVHRITARMVERGQVGLGPSDGRTVVLDARAETHDHFVCAACGGIVDLELSPAVISAIQEQLGQHLVRDGITIRGRCETCRRSEDHPKKE
ncbi:MAG: transcriptional repressor [Salinibacterium sp.]|nr:transcriptional repressor [Salinibacterium sp.]